MSHSTRRPPDSRSVLLDLGREALLDLAIHPAGRAHAEWAVHALLGVLRACRTADDLFARHNDRRLREADCAFVLSALPTRLVADHDERERLADLAFPLREAALFLRWRELAGGQ